jgi:hypothetical protein
MRFGYFFVFCLACSSADNWGPGYLGVSFGSLAPWDGGLNLFGFSRTKGFEDILVEVFLDAWRMLRDEADGMERRAVHIQPRRGSRKRGIAVVGDMMAEDNENPTKWDGQCCTRLRQGISYHVRGLPASPAFCWRR